MGAKQLAGVLTIVARQKAGDAFDEAAFAPMRDAFEAQVESQSTALFATGRLWDDGIIDPRTPAGCLPWRWPPAAIRASPTTPPPVSASSGCDDHDHRPGHANSLRRDHRRRPSTHPPAAHRQPRRDRPPDHAHRGARGIVCIAIHSDPDADALFVAEADLAVAIGGVTSAESYLDQGKVLAAAVATGADAIHPGYGFLSENAGFAQAVQDAGLIWVGPSPASIAAMAEKVPAKRLVAAAGVPLVPGAELPADASEDELLAAASEVGFPVLVKASAGGGGKGMRVVEAAAELVDAVAGARREAASAFGDPTVFFERYLPAARHIEVQVFGDARRVVHLFERECSIQRRHQKVVEEAPAPWLPTRCAAACTQRPSRRPRPSTTAARGPWSSWCTATTTTSWR